MFFWVLCAGLVVQAQEPDIIPRPTSISHRAGYFVMDKRVVIQADKEMEPVGLYLQEQCSRYYGLDLKMVNPEYTGLPMIRLKPASSRGMVKDAYKMEIDTRMITIEGDYGGVFYGVQSLLQMLDTDPAVESDTLFCMLMTDVPRFRWRGLHLDACRHFFPKEYIKKYIDRMAFYKLNMFHWHLTEDQGWRIQIKKYPRLTEVGSQRKETIVGKNFDPYIGDGKPYGGFYTQDDIREIVQYAAVRNVTVVPEIEMPGHSLAALTAYPELSCTGGPFEVGTKWGVFEDVFCPKEETFRFLEDVLTEVISLFPSKYIHIGGDEVPKVRWKNCVHCQELMKKEGLKSEEELQSYFIRRIEKFLRSKGKTLIGWDEILEGGIAPNAVVMSWRGETGGLEAARQQHEVIMTPGAPCYFDHCQSNQPGEPLCIGGHNFLKRVYDYNPIPAGLEEKDMRFILGAQANLWTEYIPDTAHLEYMLFPRLLALAEALWCTTERKNWSSFQERLNAQIPLLESRGINYRVPDAGVNGKVISFDPHPRVTMGPSPQGTSIRYTLDGTDPGSGSSLYTFPFSLSLRPKKPVQVKATVTGSSRKVYSYSNTVFEFIPLRKAGLPGQDTGLVVHYTGGHGALHEGPAFKRKKVTTGNLPVDQHWYNPAMAGMKDGNWWYSGKLKIEEEGIYTFSLRTPGDAILYVGEQPVVKVAGGATRIAELRHIWLTPGYYDFDLLYCPMGKEVKMEVNWEYGDYYQHAVPQWLHFTH